MSSRLEKRLETTARKFLLTNPALAALETRLRDEDTAIRTPKARPEPMLMIRAQDEGRIKLTPIRTLRLTITLRANAGVDAGGSDNFDSLCGAIETLLDRANLQTVLTDGPAGVYVMLATRTPSGGYAIEGDIRKQTFTLDTRCVASENVA